MRYAQSRQRVVDDGELYIVFVNGIYGRHGGRQLVNDDDNRG